jgi:phosphoglycerol transferase MdoB-like AlkP superfamily enzyme
LSERAPFFLALDASLLAALAVYRARACFLVRDILPAAAQEGGSSAYLLASAASDLVSMGFLIAVLAFLWLLSPRLKALSYSLSALLAIAASAFLVLASDFMRVYQAAFSLSYVGGEQLTGIKSMLLSASAEITPPSRIALALILPIALAAAIALLRRPPRSPALLRFSLRAQSCLAALAILALASSPFLPGAMSGRGNSAASQEVELGMNPVGAALYGPRRETYLPPRLAGGAAAIAAANAETLDTDSLERPGAFRPPVPARRGSYNVILYFFESTSWRYYGLEYGGKEVLPRMRDLAKHGLLLENHYSNYPLSANTLYSVLGSRYSMYGKSMIFHEYHDADVHTLSEVLSAKGYATAFMHTGDLLYASRDKFLADRGIDKIVLQWDLMKDAEYGKQVGWGADERSMIGPAAEWAEAQEKPFLLMLAPVNPHHPYAVPEDFPRIADPDEEGISEGEKTWRDYLNSLHYADAAMGMIVDAFEERGLMENTVFVMVADHGEAFRQHKGNYNHPLFIYEENVHVPAIFYSKALFPEGRALSSITRHVDILPSILDLVGIRDGAKREGTSIFSPSMEKLAILHTSWTDELMGIRDAKWKYIVRMKDAREELYDLEADPFEKTNLAEEEPSIALRYRGAVDKAVSYMLADSESLPRKP